MIYFHSIKNPGFILDIVQDVKLLNDSVIRASQTGLLILGGGLIKHHLCNANLLVASYDVLILLISSIYSVMEQSLPSLLTQGSNMTEAMQEQVQMKLFLGEKLKWMPVLSR
jgi:Deoxyhypusine synthase